MKKLLALLLSLMLLLPAVSLGEAAIDACTEEFDDFYLTYTSLDILQKGEKTEGGILFVLFPAYSEADTFHNNINAVWTAENVVDLGGYTVEDFAAAVITNAANGLAAQNIAATNAQLLGAQQDAETGAITVLYSMDMDYSASGVDLVLNPLYQLQLYCPAGELGSYVFTISSTSLEDAEIMLNYINAIEFK